MRAVKKGGMICLGSVVLLTIFLYIFRPAWFPPFYYDNYDEIRASLEAIPGLKIIDDWQHHDLTLEDCGFTIVVGDSRPVQLDFWGCDPSDTAWRELDGILVEPTRRVSLASNLPTAYLRKEDLKNAGIGLTTMESVFENLDPLLALAEKNPNGDLRPQNGEVFKRIFFGADQRKQGE